MESQARQATRTINGLHNPAVKALYDRLRARGKRGDVACGIHGNVLDFWAAWRRLPPREMD